MAKNDDALLEIAIALHRKGDLAAAITAYQSALAGQPGNTVILANLASVLKQVGQLKESLACYTQCLQQNPPTPEIWFNAGNLMQAMDFPLDAERVFLQAIKLKPDFVAPQLNLGNLYRDQKKYTQAEHCYRICIKYKPNMARAHCYLGQVLLAQNKTEDALLSFREAVKLDARDPFCHFQLARGLAVKGDNEAAIRSLNQALLREAGHVGANLLFASIYAEAEDYKKAITVLEKALQANPDSIELILKLIETFFQHKQYDKALQWCHRGVELEPNNAELLNTFGVVSQANGQFDEALAHWQKAVQLKPDHAPAYCNIGMFYRLQKKPNEAVAALRHATQINPALVDAQIGLAYTLLDVGEISEALSIANQVVEKNPQIADGYMLQGYALTQQARIDEALNAFDKANELTPGNGQALSNQLFSSLYSDQLDATAIRQLHEKLTANIVNGVTPYTDWSNDRDLNKKLRVGYVSPDLSKHPVGYFMLPILANHDPEQVEITCYSLRAHDDDMSRQLRRHAQHWRDCYHWPDEKLAEQIRADEIDILVDLTGHTAANRIRLFAAKPAPVQVLYLGYPATTGLKQMDVILADAQLVPAGYEQYYTEQVARLADSFLCYQPREDAPDIEVAPVETNGFITFGSYNNTPKLSATTLQLWSEVLKAVPGSRFALKTLAMQDAGSRKYFINKFEALGIDPERIICLPPSKPEEFMAEYNKIDIALDTYPFNGGTTTCDALWMGVPVISMSGKRFVSRMGGSLLSVTGLSELTSETRAEFVGIATALANDRARLASLRQDMRQRMLDSPLCQARPFTQDMEKIYVNLWQRFITE